MLKEKELLLLSILRNNSRMPLTQLSRKTKIPISTIFEKLKEFESKLIRKHTTLLDFKQLGFDIKINILLSSSTKEGKKRIQDFLLKNENINSVFKVNNGFDFLVEGIFRDIKQLNEFLNSLENFKLKEKKEFFILEEIKREDFMTLKNPFSLKLFEA